MQHDASPQMVDATVYEVDVIDDRGVERVAVAMRERTGELKKKATTSNEKATIEIVALMLRAFWRRNACPHRASLVCKTANASVARCLRRA